jgi:hypothetical protein
MTRFSLPGKTTRAEEFTTEEVSDALKEAQRKICPWTLGPEHLPLQATIHANTNPHDSRHKPDGLHPRAD